MLLYCLDSATYLRLQVIIRYRIGSPLTPNQSQLPLDLDLPMHKVDFREVAVKLEGSRDIGAQLFCALLRSTRVDARLVCSLQPLPFTGTAKGSTPLKAKPAIIVSYPETRAGLSDGDSGAEGGSDSSVRTAVSTSTNGATRRIGSKLAPRSGLIPHDPSPIIASTVSKSMSNLIKFYRLLY